MKNRHLLVAGMLSVTCSLLVTSCTKFEDRNYRNIVSNDFAPTPSDIASLTGSGYAFWRPLMLGRSNNSIFRTNEISSDEAVIPARPNGWVDGGIYRRMHEHKWTSDEANSTQIWNQAFGGITSCNRLIYQMQSGLIPIGAEKTATIAELRVLRASFYYALCEFFGNVPIVTDFDLPPGFLPEQSPRTKVYNFIVQEITESLALLSLKNDQSTYGRFNKGAANALLAKVYLQAEVYTGTPAWDKCIAVCNEIINSGSYSLESNQSNVFITENQNSKEIIFAIPFDEKFTPDGLTAFCIHRETLQPENQATYNLKTSPLGGICAIPQFVNTFDTQDGRLKTTFIQGPQFSATGSPLICTLGAFKGQALTFLNEVPGIDSAESVHGYRLGKFEYKQGALIGLSNDWPLFRYADVLMMKAECLLRTGDANGAAALVTQVRQRAFAANPAKAVVTGVQLMQPSVYDYGLRNHFTITHETNTDMKYGRFLDELGWEFSLEGRRRQDLIRFGVFTKKSWLSHSPNGDYRTLLPLPRVEINKNPNLKQNAGY